MSSDLPDDYEAEEELEALALEGLNSGDPFEPGPGYWEERHRRLNEALKSRIGRECPLRDEASGGTCDAC
jgi:hypothetical protein